MNERNTVIEKFYVENRNALIKRVSYRAGGEYNAEDVVAEAFVRALKYWNSFDPSRHELGSWFSSILNNALTNFNKEELQYGMCVDIEDHDVIGIDLNTVDRELYKDVLALIEEQDDAVKYTLILHFKHQYKTGEIMEITGDSRRNVTQRLYRFREELREKLRVH